MKPGQSGNCKGRPACASLSPATTHANALSCALSAASGLKSKKDIDRLVVDRFKVDAVFESGK
jgi:hypothetical protein